MALLLWITLSLHLSANLVSGNLPIPDDKIARMPRMEDPEEKAVLGQPRKERQERSSTWDLPPSQLVRRFKPQDNSECQSGDPPGAFYSGTVNVTKSGLPCLSWTHELLGGFYGYREMYGDINYCRNPYGGRPEGVYCYTDWTPSTGYAWEYCPVPICKYSMKVLDFSADDDQKPDSNGEYTSATLEGGALTESFTICTAFMVDAWTTMGSAQIFVLLDPDFQDEYGSVSITRDSYYSVQFGYMNAGIKQSETLFFPLQWTHVCFSLDSNASKVMLVVDGKLLVEQEYTLEEIRWRPYNLSLLLGSSARSIMSDARTEYTGKIADFNVFNSSSLERMVRLTEAGHEECGAPGDLVSWEEAEWTLHSQAKLIDRNVPQHVRDWEEPCRRESKVHVFIEDFGWHHQCMQHCSKINGGRTPSLYTREEWKSLELEFYRITRNPRLDMGMDLWSSATEGDSSGTQLARLEHWPETELVNNETKKLEALENVWRDFYSGQRLDDYIRPYWSPTGPLAGNSSNCVLHWCSGYQAFWYESQCTRPTEQLPVGCPCSYPAQPLLRLRGLCSDWVENLFSPKQLPDNPSNIFYLGKVATRIEYNDSSSQWVLTDAKHGVTAVSKATKLSYALGKNEWTISNDVYECSNGKPYTKTLKLSGCNPEGEFTCDDGQCIKMEARCNQVLDCRDESDERQCHLIIFKDNYNKNIPPIGRSFDGAPVPTDVNISITLMKVVEIEETDHSIHLQFQISLQWRENRVKYRNLKQDSALNAISDDDIKALWLPLVLYDNTDQKDVTRLGMAWEWNTFVTVSREGDFERSGIDIYDEIEIFTGAENRLTMNQTYTLEFQCKYQLQHYPFDTQVLQETKIDQWTILL